MQFHLNGYQGSDDPLKTQYTSDNEPDFQTSLPTSVDVLIVGAGPAGQLLATQLSRFPDITTRIVEQKPGPLVQGNADGLQCRTIEVLEAFGFGEKVLKEGYWVNEICFWSPGEDGTELQRSGRIRDTEAGLSEMPHIILNQARLQGMWLESMKWSPTRLEPTYSRKMLELERPVGHELVKVTFERVDGAHAGAREVVYAKYVVGCDGARSGVRRALGLEMKGDYKNQVWGVLDALIVTTFPDLRVKSNIHSANDGTVIIIPREGGYLARFYIGMDECKPNDRDAIKRITCDMIIDRAKRIFRPFTFDVRQVAHWSVYEVGQRLTDHFDDVPISERESRTPQVFITGDACHTHSAKAGQGMNVSMNDSFNLGWKLASVLRGTAEPRILHTYTAERQDIAQKLIDFDVEISRMTAAKPSSRTSSTLDPNAVAPAAFQDYFQRKANFMAGVQTTYPCGGTPLTLPESQTHQTLAPGFQIGTRFHSVQVLRCADAKPVHLGHTLTADGRWRIILFDHAKSQPTSPSSDIWQTCAYLEKKLIPRYTPETWDIDSVIDMRAVLQVSRKEICMPELPPILLPAKGKLGLQDYEKVFTDEESYGFGFGEIYKTRGVDREKGCLVIVRPDQHISGILQLSGEETQNVLREFFDGFMVTRRLVTNGVRTIVS